MVTLIHNVLTTDYVALIHDDDCVMGLELLERRLPLVETLLRLPQGKLSYLEGLFGISGICNVLGAIRLARHLNLGAEDNVITIATDGFDRYPSVLADLAERRGPIDAGKLGGWFESVFRGGSEVDILDVRPRAEKERLFACKEEVWSGFGYSHAYLDQMKSQSFWEAQFDAIDGIDQALTTTRKLQVG
jgi:hypothetical protein